jgi:hypothetical protein
MSLSLNEVEVMAKKAARGAGYPWGLAEEAGKTSRWLCAQDIDGCAALARLLESVDGADLRNWTPDVDQDTWTASGGTLCPLVTGAAITDRARALRDNCIRVGKIAEPALLVQFVALAAQQIDGIVNIAWPGTFASTDGENLAVDGTFPTYAAQAKISLGGNVANPNRQQSRARPKTDIWNKLSQFANRTYAPATEESRQRGAGAGESDNG